VSLFELLGSGLRTSRRMGAYRVRASGVMDLGASGVGWPTVTRVELTDFGVFLRANAILRRSVTDPNLGGAPY
jgi:hypothetical protein